MKVFYKVKKSGSAGNEIGENATVSWQCTEMLRIAGDAACIDADDIKQKSK